MQCFFCGEQKGENEVGGDGICGFISVLFRSEGCGRLEEDALKTPRRDEGARLLDRWQRGS